jgi:hypothetical protein
MKPFLSQLIKFFLLVIIAHCLMVLLSVVVSKKINKTSHLASKKTNNEGAKIYIIGNSHPACAINDSLLPDNYINIAQFAEPLFYSVVKARKLIEENKKIDTIVIEFTNNSLSTVGWVINNDRLFENYQTYFPNMNFQEHYFLFSHNLKKSLKTFFSLSPRRIWLSIKTVNGRYRYLVRNEIVSPETKQKKTDKPIKEKVEHNKTLEYTGFENLIALIKTNPKIHFILTRLPLHSSYNGFKNETAYQQCLEQIKGFENCRYIDFKNTSLENYCFGDSEHLNHLGAVVFTPIFLDSIRLTASQSNQNP